MHTCVMTNTSYTATGKFTTTAKLTADMLPGQWGDAVREVLHTMRTRLSYNVPVDARITLDTGRVLTMHVDSIASVDGMLSGTVDGRYTSVHPINGVVKLASTNNDRSR